MIFEETLEIKKNGKNLTVSEIENAIKTKGIDPIRYSILKVTEDALTVSVSGIKQDLNN